MHTRSSTKTAFFLLAFAAACGGGATEDPTPDTNVSTVTITSGATTIAPGTTVQMVATPRNAAGTAISGLSASWSSSATAVATVSSTGLVSGLTTGSTVISATISGVVGTRNLAVQTITPVQSAAVEATAGSSFNPSQVDITVGGTVTWTFSAEHNVTFAAATGAPANIANTSSGSVPRTFNSAGSFTYNCTLHVGMSGAVIVH
jgi:plastocyanin